MDLVHVLDLLIVFILIDNLLYFQFEVIEVIKNLLLQFIQLFLHPHLKALEITICNFWIIKHLLNILNFNLSPPPLSEKHIKIDVLIVISVELSSFIDLLLQSLTTLEDARKMLDAELMNVPRQREISHDEHLHHDEVDEMRRLKLV